MKKDELIKLGLTEELAAKVESASAEELKGFIPKSRFDEVNTDLKTAKETITERDKQIEGLKKSSGDSEALKKQIEQIQSDNKKKDEEHAAEIKRLKIDAAIDTALTEAKAKNLKAAKALLDMEKITLNDKGEISGLSEQIKSLTGSKDTSFIFDSKGGSFRGAKHGEDGHDDGDGKPDFGKMTYAELAQYLSENPEAKLE